METVELNIKRLEHLMALYGVSTNDLLSRLNESKKRTLDQSQVFKSAIPLSLLKQIDKIFKRGLAYYLDPKDPISSKDESIFFRKEIFNAELNLGARQIVNKFEQEKLSFSALMKLADFKMNRQLSIYKVTDNPKLVASEVRQYLYPIFDKDKKEFLKNFIAKLSEVNVLVFEFIERFNKKEKANFNGFFLSPNVIVLKRDQKYLRREIFTLAHELGHYLLDEEEIDDKISGDINHYDNTSDTERWCSDFAFFFLAGEYSKEIENIENASASNDYHHELISELSRRTHLSKFSLYFRLLLNKKVSNFDYNRITNDLWKDIEEFELDKKRKQEIEKQKAIEEGRKQMAGQPKPIISPLYLSTLRGALNSGLISEWEFGRRLNVDGKTLDKLLA